MLDKLRCAKCGKRPEEDSGYRSIVEEELGRKASVEEVRQYIWDEEGTLNTETGAYLCDMCYIIAGMPVNEDGRRWTVPKGQEWQGS